MTAPIGMGKFVGAPVRAQTFEGVSVAENTYAAGLRVEAHAHDAPLLSLVLQGTRDRGDRQSDARAGRAEPALHAVVRDARPPVPHAGPLAQHPVHRALVRARRCRRGRVADRATDRARRRRDHVGRAARRRAPRAGPRLTLRDRGRAPAPRRRPVAAAGARRAAASALAPESSRTRSKPRARRRPRSRTSPRSPACTRPICCARSAGITARRSRHTFRRRRIERARVEVANGDRPLSMIALDAGFSDQSHFTRVFRQAFGETPGQYARSLRGR